MFDIHFDVKTDSGLIKCKAFTLKEYLNLIIAKSNSNSDLMKLAYNEIIKNNTNATNLSKHDAELILVNLIIKSEYENSVYKDYVCECGNEIKVEIDPSKIRVDYDGKNINDLYPFDKFKLLFKWPELWSDDNIADMIVRCIDSIFVGDERIKLDDLSEEELDDLYELLTLDEIEKIKDFLLAPQISLIVSFKCDKCGKRHTKTIKGLKSFLEII